MTANGNPGMFHTHQIESLDLPELAPYRTMKRSVEHETQGIFVAEGDKVVHRLLESDFPVVSVLLPEKRLAEFEPKLQTRPENIPVYLASNKHVLEALVGFDLFQGVMAVGKIPGPVTLADVFARSTNPHLFVAVDGLTNSENLGVLVRNCAAFGTQALFVGETCASPFLRRAVRNSMGTIFQLPVVASANLAETLRALRARGVRCVAAHPHVSGRSVTQTDFTGDCCIVVGSEGHGLSPAVLAACDEAAAIPMARNVDSLNVGNAAAVFLYEASRQRGGGDPPL
jgi:tRNA G18 (ribose-2'-O)-methylase SpoU